MLFFIFCYMFRPHILTILSRSIQVKKKLKWSRYKPGVAQRVGRGITLLFHDRSTRRGWVVSSTPRPHFTTGERPGTHFPGGWMGPRAGLDGRKISSPSGFDHGPSSPDIPTQLPGPQKYTSTEGRLWEVWVVEHSCHWGVILVIMYWETTTCFGPWWPSSGCLGST